MNRKKSDISDTEWNAIVDKAFSADAPEPEFSKFYYQHRQELERKVIMKENHQSERRSKAGFAALSVCAAGMAGLMLYGGTALYQNAHQMESDSQFAPAESVNITAEEAAPQEAFDVEVTFPYEEDEYTQNGGIYGLVHDGNISVYDNGDFIQVNTTSLLTEHEKAFEEEFIRMAENEPFTETIESAYGSETFQTDSDNEAVYVICSDFRLLYIHFTGTPYVAKYSIKGLTTEEIHAFANDAYLEAYSTGFTEEDECYVVEYEIDGIDGDEYEIDGDDDFSEAIYSQCVIVTGYDEELSENEEDENYTVSLTWRFDEGNYNDYTVMLDWLPEGVSYQAEGAYEGKYADSAGEKVITPWIYLLPNESGSEWVDEISCVTDVFDCYLDDTNNTKYMLLLTCDADYDVLYLMFNNSILSAYYLKGFTQEEAIQLAENANLAEICS